MNTMRYAHNTIFIAENKEDIVKQESRKKVLEFHNKKTEVMVFTQNNEGPHINISINGNKFKKRDHFKYLGTLIPNNGRNNTEIASRKAQANKKISKELNRY